MMVHVQSRLLYNCCKAYPERVELDWLEQNPGRLFHTDTMLADRKLMLEDKSCASCHHGCYKYEEQGLSSTRQQHKNHTKISDPQAPLRDLTISLSTDCNMTCMYCSPEWSSSWHKDIAKNGAHELIGFKLDNDNFSDLWAKIKQKSRSTDSRFFDLLLREIKLADGLESISIMGGEPLLNNQLEEVIDASGDKTISISTGLGVSHSRLSTLLKKIKNRKIRFTVSGETTGKFFELIRYGTTWGDFKERVRMIEDNGHKIVFISTMSNISILDFKNFYETYHKRHKIHVNKMSDRPFLMPHVLDDRSKENFILETRSLNNVPQFQEISRLVNLDPSETDRSNFGNYLKQFSSRRSMDIGFLPEHFRKWCGL
jgi:hypothetical protein